jgi:hypothetical protein
MLPCFPSLTIRHAAVGRAKGLPIAERELPAVEDRLS